MKESWFEISPAQRLRRRRRYGSVRGEEEEEEEERWRRVFGTTPEAARRERPSGVLEAWRRDSRVSSSSYSYAAIAM